MYSNSYRETDSNSDNYLLIAKLKGRIAVKNPNTGKPKANKNILIKER
jgi:hypothetical protein